MNSRLLGRSKVPTRSATTGLSSIAPILLPHIEQKARLEKSDERHVAGVPAGPVQLTASFGNSTQAVVRLPVWCWHIRQEQVCGFSSTPTASNLVAPQRQPPRYLFGLTGDFLTKTAPFHAISAARNDPLRTGLIRRAEDVQITARLHPIRLVRLLLSRQP